MMRPIPCARCGRESDAGAASCLGCGQPLRTAPPPLPPTCAACGARLQAAFRFCGRCGASVGATPSSPPPPRTPAPPPLPPAAGSVRRGDGPALAPATPLDERPLPRAGARIVAVRGDGLPGMLFDLRDDETICGRSEGAIRLADDPTVSPRHARFTLRRGLLAVEDLGSANGTFVRIRAPRQLEPGDELRVGRQLLRVEPLPEPAAAEPGGVRAWGTPDPGFALRLAQLLDGGGVGEIFPLREGESALGREAADVTFPTDRYVSARHARLDVRGGAVTVADVGSSNGTFVRISGPTELAPGDQLLVGAQLLRVEA